MSREDKTPVVQLTKKQLIALLSFLILTAAPNIWKFIAKTENYKTSFSGQRNALTKLKKRIDRLEAMRLKDRERHDRNLDEFKERILKELKDISFELGSLNGELKRIR